MITYMNQYVDKIHLISDDITKNLFIAALRMDEAVEEFNVIIRNAKFIVDIKLKHYSIQQVTKTMNQFMEATRYPYSAFYLRFNEGSQIRYRYASCKEDKSGFYCDVIIS